MADYQIKGDEVDVFSEKITPKKAKNSRMMLLF